MSSVTDLHDAVKRGDLAALQRLLDTDRALANSRSESDARGTFPLHVAAEFDRADAARVLLQCAVAGVRRCTCGAWRLRVTND